MNWDIQVCICPVVGPKGRKAVGLSIYCDLSCGFSMLNLNGQFGGFAAVCIYMKHCFTLFHVFCCVQTEPLDWPQLQVGTILSFVGLVTFLKRYYNCVECGV